MRLAQNDDVIQTLTPDRSDRPFGKPFCQGEAGAVGLSRRSAGSSGRLQVEVKASSPRRQLVNRPHPRTLGQRLMPRPRLENVELRNKHVHIGIELDQKTTWVVVIRSKVVARGVP